MEKKALRQVSHTVEKKKNADSRETSITGVVVKALKKQKKKTKRQVSWKRKLAAFHWLIRAKILSQNRKLQRIKEKRLPNKPRSGASDCRLASVGSLLPTGSFCSYALSILSHALLPKENLLSRTQVAITALNK